ncbi:MAG: hypothetical protein PHU04_01860 [Candidatus Peribacteraceae bacterium]|nr:hypothetical protein [Candidatus Peribacteraceae bacterium]
MAGIAPIIAAQYSLDRRREGGSSRSTRPEDDVPANWATVKLYFPLGPPSTFELQNYLQRHNIDFRTLPGITEQDQNVRSVCFDTTNISPEAVLAVCKEFGLTAKLDQTMVQRIGSSVRGLLRHVFAKNTTPQDK